MFLHHLHPKQEEQRTFLNKELEQFQAIAHTSGALQSTERIIHKIM